MRIFMCAAVAVAISGCGGGGGDSTPADDQSGNIINVSGRYQIVEEDAPRQCSGTLLAVFGGTTDAGVEGDLIIIQTDNQLQGAINDTTYVGTLNDDLSFRLDSAVMSGNILFTSTLRGSFNTFGRVSGTKLDAQGDNFIDENMFDGFCGAEAIFEGVRL